MRLKLVVGLGKRPQFPEAEKLVFETREEVAEGLGAGTGLEAALGFTVHWASTTVPELL